MLEHEVKINSNLRYKGNKTPVRNLLDKFASNISLKKNQESRKLIDVSCKTVIFLEKFYKC